MTPAAPCRSRRRGARQPSTRSDRTSPLISTPSLANWRCCRAAPYPLNALRSKADAYGYGHRAGGPRASAGCKTYFVATLAEAGASARRAESQDTCSTGSSLAHRPHLIDLECRPVIGDIGELPEWDAFCRHRGVNSRRGPAHRHRHEPPRLEPPKRSLIPRVEQG